MDSGLFKKMGSWFVRYIWPWIVAYVWPSIEKMVLQLFETVIVDLSKRMEETLKERNKKHQEDAYTEAVRAEEQAARTPDPVAAAQLRAEAEAWKNQAETFRREIDELRATFEDFKAKGTRDFSRGLSGLPLAELVSVDKKGRLTVPGLPEPLPQLPAPSEQGDELLSSKFLGIESGNIEP